MALFSEVSICNMALTELGISTLIEGSGDLADSADLGITVEHKVATLWYEKCRDRLLGSFPWPFARGYILLTLVDDGDGELWEHEWENAYEYPADALRLWRFVTDARTGNIPPFLFDPNQYGRGGDRYWHYRFVLRQHGGTKVILTDVEPADAKMEYTRQITDPEEFDESFAELLSVYLATKIAMPLSVDPGKRQQVLQLFAIMERSAKGVAFNEENDRDPGDEEFVRSRTGYW